MRPPCRWTVFGVLLGTVSMTAAAQQATQAVTIIVEEVNNLSLVADVAVALPSDLMRPVREVDAAPSATYAFSTNGYGKKITGQLGAGGTSDLALDVALTAPTESGSSTGSRTLDRTIALDLLTDVSRVKQSGLSVSYTVSTTANAPADTEPGGLQIVTFTVSDR